MKTTITALAIAMAAVPAYAEDLVLIGDAEGPVYSVDSRDIDRLDARADYIGGRVSEAASAAVGAAAMSAIEFIGRVPQIGVGAAQFEGRTGWAIKGMVPLGGRAHGSLGAFGAGGDVGVAGGIVIGF